MEISLNNFRKSIQNRKETDHSLSQIWVIVFLLPIFIGIISSLYFLVTLIEVFSTINFSNPQTYTFTYDWFSPEFMVIFLILGISGLINLILAFILNFLLIKRRQNHFKRQKLLSEEIIALLLSFAKIKNVELEINQFSIRKTIKKIRYNDEKNPILWAVLSVFVPFLQFYVFNFLMNDFFLHEQKEDTFLNDVGNALKNLGINFSVTQRRKNIPDRSLVLFLILTVVSAGLFIVYWIYILIKDPNEHFKYHIQVENQLLISLESARI
ncbi:hypothetical protein KJN74_05935 [Candidatus Bathyarchaeota archaeon]|nr:hypothetical protein [Candidatus Bathyarchaeota archaeon]